MCNHEGHQRGEAPALFAGLSKPDAGAKGYDVPVTVLSPLRREGN